MTTPLITITSPFPTGELPSLFCWRNRLHKLAGEEPEELEGFMQAHLNTGPPGFQIYRQTYAAYRDSEIGGFFEVRHAAASFAGGMDDLTLAKVSMIFKREFFGERNTRPALNLVLAELFTDHDLVLFPLAASNRPIQSLVSNVGAVNIGAITDDNETLWVLSPDGWAKSAVTDRTGPMRITTPGQMIIGAPDSILEQS